MRSVCLMLAVLAVGTTACGSGQPLTVKAQSDTPIERRLVGCGRSKYDRSALRGPTGAENSDHPAAAALREEIKASEGAELRPTKEWRLLLDEGDRVIFGGGEFEKLSTEGLAAQVHVQKKGDDWVMAGSSYGCHLTVDTGRDSPIYFALAAGVAPPPEARKMDLLIIDQSCGGEDVLPRLHPPLIQYGQDAVDVLLTASPLPDGNYTCQGFPPTPWVLELDQAVGHRAIRNAAVYPPSPAEL